MIKSARKLDLRDLWIAIAILAVFSPIYLVALHEIPWQVNTDEVTIMLFSEKIAGTPGTNPFGLSDYWGFPALPFYIFGNLAEFLGGMSLLNMRTIHAISGLLTIAAAYIFFRAFASRGVAAVGAIVL